NPGAGQDHHCAAVELRLGPGAGQGQLLDLEEVTHHGRQVRHPDFGVVVDIAFAMAGGEAGHGLRRPGEAEAAAGKAALGEAAQGCWVVVFCFVEVRSTTPSTLPARATLPEQTTATAPSMTPRRRSELSARPGRSRSSVETANPRPTRVRSRK